LPAANFAALARTAPNPSKTTHEVEGVAAGQIQVGYTCHMAAMHWAFMDLGDSGADANVRLQAINVAKCPACDRPRAEGERRGHVHASILHPWYGEHFCGGARAVARRDDLYARVNVGDVVIVGEPRAPAHTMVVVQKSSWLGRRFVYIRGFNNYGTLGTGVYNQYDNADRDIDRGNFWHTGDAEGAPTVFGRAWNTGGPLHVIPYETYSDHAQAVRNRCGAAGYADP
jgi:hypothetical protein